MPLTILVADDDLGTRISVSDYLELLGYSVIVAKDGKQALSMIDKYQPHALITDINMPRMDGYELVRQVREKPQFRLFPVVFLSERNTVEERIRGYKAGCDSYLPKPFEIQELAVVIRNLIDKSLVLPWTLLNPLTQETPKPSPEVDPVCSEETAPSTPLKPTTSKSFDIKFTEREKEVLQLLTKGGGLTNREIGTKLHLSHKTVEKHVSTLFRKTQTNNRTELSLFAVENHLVD
jgi:DNA-binding NarL/FixJ family response regulator